MEMGLALPVQSAHDKSLCWGRTRHRTCSAQRRRVESGWWRDDSGLVGHVRGRHGRVGGSGRFPCSPAVHGRQVHRAPPYTWVRGFPSVLYGFNQCHASTSPRVSQLLPLPMRVSAIPADLIGTTSYSLRKPQRPTTSRTTCGSTSRRQKKPCQTNGTVEVMVWFDYDRLALLPGSMEVATASIPFAVNGTANNGKQAWGVFTSNLYAGGRTAPWGGTIWFVLNAADRVGSGSVRVDLSSVLSAAGTLLQNRYGWRNFKQSYWLDTIPFGMEYGPGRDLVRGRVVVLLPQAFFLLSRGGNHSVARDVCRPDANLNAVM